MPHYSHCWVPFIAEKKETIDQLKTNTHNHNFTSLLELRVLTDSWYANGNTCYMKNWLKNWHKHHKIVIKISDNAEKDKLIKMDLVHPQQHEKIHSFCCFVWIVVWPFCLQLLYIADRFCPVEPLNLCCSSSVHHWTLCYHDLLTSAIHEVL